MLSLLRHFRTRVRGRRPPLWTLHDVWGGGLRGVGQIDNERPLLLVLFYLRIAQNVCNKLRLSIAFLVLLLQQRLILAARYATLQRTKLLTKSQFSRGRVNLLPQLLAGGDVSLGMQGETSCRGSRRLRILQIPPGTIGGALGNGSQTVLFSNFEAATTVSWLFLRQSRL